MAGKMQGMSKGSDTRSGLLWEVERLLGEVNELPQVLLMENVPQVISDANIADFRLWQDFLESKGYTNYVEVLNAKDFGVAQNRERAFMVSLLGQWNYKFPKTIPLTKTIADYLEDGVDEKYYINSKKAKRLINELIISGKIPTDRQTDRHCVDGTINNPGTREVANCIKARYDAGISNFRSEGNMVVERCKTRRGRVQDNGDTCPALTATETGICRIETPYRIRKLTPLECWKLMDFTEADFRRAEAVNSNTQLYKQAGNSIVKAVLMAIFKQMM